MLARVQVYDITGKTQKGVLDTIGLTFSEEIGGAGTCTFEALEADVNALSAWDSVIKIGLETAPNVWMLGPAYVMRREWSNNVGSWRYSFTCRNLLEAWASETVLLPEYIVGAIPQRAGEERGLGWMSSAYNTATDPQEPWNKIQSVPATPNHPAAGPPKWPTGSGAQWVTASGATASLQGKYFRGTMTITGTAARVVQVWISSDESATLWVGGEKVIETSSSEDGYKTFETKKMNMYPGTYAVGIYTGTANNTGGGDGIDPVIFAAATLGTDGVVSQWIGKTTTAWDACRRALEPPNDTPPGPTPGAMMLYMVQEAKERKASGWFGVGQSYTGTADSYGKSWGALDIIERIMNYGTTTYWDIFQAFSESDDVDIWMTSDLVLHAAPRQGQTRSLTFDEDVLYTFKKNGTEGNGTWVMAKSHAGWITAGAGAGALRREYAIEVGQAATTAIAKKIATASLRDTWRTDAAGSLKQPTTGWIPYVNYKLGDIVYIAYGLNGLTIYQMSITSLSAKVGEGASLLWDIEFTEYPPVSNLQPI